MRLIATPVLLAALAGCGRAGVFLQSDKDVYEMSGDAGVAIFPRLESQVRGEATYSPCNFSLGINMFGYSSLEWQSDAGWIAAGRFENQQGPTCNLKIGCALSAGGMQPPAARESRCAFRLGLDPDEPLGKYRFVTTVEIVFEDGSPTERRRVTSNVFQVRAPDGGQ